MRYFWIISFFPLCLPLWQDLSGLDDWKRDGPGPRDGYGRVSWKRVDLSEPIDSFAPSVYPRLRVLLPWPRKVVGWKLEMKA